jgi:hypothetical protein
MGVPHLKTPPRWRPGLFALVLALLVALVAAPAVRAAPSDAAADSRTVVTRTVDHGPEAQSSRPSPRSNALPLLFAAIVILALLLPPIPYGYHSMHSRH